MRWRDQPLLEQVLVAATEIEYWGANNRCFVNVLAVILIYEKNSHSMSCIHAERERLPNFDRSANPQLPPKRYVHLDSPTFALTNNKPSERETQSLTT